MSRTIVKRITLLLVTFAVAAGSAFAADGTQIKGPFAGTVHAVGAITYKDGSHQSWTWDRGAISALSADSITLTRADKAKVSFAITPSTLVRNDGSSYTLADLKLGLRATVISQDGNAAIIRRLRGDGAPSGAEQSAIEGPARGSVTGSIVASYKDGNTSVFDYNRGRIMSVGDSQLVITRADKQTVSFTYDSTLLLREQGNVVGLDELKVGEGAMFFSQGGKLVLVRCLHAPKAAPAAAPAP